MENNKKEMEMRMTKEKNIGGGKRKKNQEEKEERGMEKKEEKRKRKRGNREKEEKNHPSRWVESSTIPIKDRHSSQRHTQCQR